MSVFNENHRIVRQAPDLESNPPQPEPVPVLPPPPPPKVKREHPVLIDGRLHAEEPVVDLINLVTPRKPAGGPDDSFSTLALHRVENEVNSAGPILITICSLKTLILSK